MISKEILKKVKRIEISTRGMVNEIFSGQYHSVFKGRGMDFSEVREYQPGDDIRTIDWNVTARSGHPFVKVYQEERELTVMLLVDASSSVSFGSIEQMKGELAVELCALLAFSAIKNNDKVGLLIFTNQVEKFVPPRKGKKHVMRVIRELLYYRPTNEGTDIGKALEYLNHILRRRAVVFLVSDFLGQDFERHLRVANRRHDIIAMRITDKREKELPNIGLLELEDIETDESLLIDTSDSEFREAYRTNASKMNESLHRMFKSMKVDYIEFRPGAPYDLPLIRFFKERSRRTR
jgi:uncharacterized protein (DUF58 family)